MNKVDSTNLAIKLISPSQYQDGDISITFIKNQLNHLNQTLFNQFSQHHPVADLIHIRTQFIDELLIRLWDYFKFNEKTHQSLSLIAVGGYGRQELFPQSDIDILILSHDILSQEEQNKVEQFVRFLWDLRLHLGQSIYTLEQALNIIKDDVTIFTNLLESRYLSGDHALFNELQRYFQSDFVSIEQFYQLKLNEQLARHQKYQGTTYNLEPDLKQSPGGLRDLHTILWIAKYYFTLKPTDYIQFQKTYHNEASEFEEYKTFLWTIRFGLHLIVSKPDNRLLFEHQLTLATLLGYQGEGNQPVEAMMRHYYQVVHNVNELNKLMMATFDELIHPLTGKSYPIDANFSIHGDLLHINQADLFIHHPEMMLTLFYLNLTEPKIKGFTAFTIQRLRLAKRQNSSLLCYQPACREQFMAIINHPNAILGALIPMHQYGILSIYLPHWRDIVGLMQFDLFHAYTVDEHTIRLLLELDKLKSNNQSNSSPKVRQVLAELSRIDLLIIAGLFHDIAKGQKQDHALLGAQWVNEFFELHDLPNVDKELVHELVQHHLLMSKTAQSQDIHDPDVIRTFSSIIQSKRKLKYLFCLSVADICATNQNLWNSWKESLFSQLYTYSYQYFDSGMSFLPDQRNVSRENRKQVQKELMQQGYLESDLTMLWQNFRADYFFKYSPTQISWQTKLLLNHKANESLVKINSNPAHGGTEIFIYAEDRPFLFAKICNVLTQKNLIIHQALITTNKIGMALDSFIVLSPDGQSIKSDRYHDIEQSILKSLTKTYHRHDHSKLTLGKQIYFSVTTNVYFTHSLNQKKTHLELVTLDKPGLLALIGEVFAEFKLNLFNAKISTFGERVEDYFILSNHNHMALSDEECHQLKQALINIINDH